MRPSVAGMLDCRIRIWRPTVSKDDIGVEDRTYTPVGEVDAYINRPRQPLVNMGAGMAPTGGTRWYGLPSIDVQKRDVCEVVTGPETGKTFEVNEPPVRPKNHHVEVECHEWSGELPYHS